MEPIDLVFAFVLGITVGYAIRAAISAVRRQKAYHYRREQVRVAAESAERLRAAVGTGSERPLYGQSRAHGIVPSEAPERLPAAASAAS
jgi:plasmid stabilization system protein ParE